MGRVSFLSYIRYHIDKLEYSIAFGLKLCITSFALQNPSFEQNYAGGFVKRKELSDFVVKHFIHGRLTFLHWTKGEEMAPTIDGKRATLLVRKLVAIQNLKIRFRLPLSQKTWTWPYTFERQSHIERDVFVGDVVVLKNPEEPDNYLVRRVAAIEGDEMASTNEEEESFVLKKNQYWVLAENEKLKAKEAFDSRTFGPVHMSNIKGRVIYCLRSAVDHGRVQNSHFSMQKDSPVLEVELDIDEMAKSPKA